MIWAVALSTCISQSDVKSKICWALCRASEGAYTGYYIEEKKSCICGFLHKFEVFTEAVIRIPRQPKIKGEYE